MEWAPPPHPLQWSPPSREVVPSRGQVSGRYAPIGRLGALAMNAVRCLMSIRSYVNAIVSRNSGRFFALHIKI